MVTADTCGDINTLQRTEGKAIRMKGKCGITSGMVQKGLSGGSGSVSNTSSIAPPNHPSLWQRIAAFLTTLTQSSPQ